MDGIASPEEVANSRDQPPRRGSGRRFVSPSPVHTESLPLRSRDPSGSFAWNAKRPQSSRGGLMRSFTWLSPGWALGQFHSWSQRLRRSLLTLSPAIRWALTAGALTSLGFLAYLGSTA